MEVGEPAMMAPTERPEVDMRFEIHRLLRRPSSNSGASLSREGTSPIAEVLLGSRTTAASALRASLPRLSCA